MPILSILSFGLKISASAAAASAFFFSSSSACASSASNCFSASTPSFSAFSLRFCFSFSAYHLRIISQSASVLSALEMNDSIRSMERSTTCFSVGPAGFSVGELPPEVAAALVALELDEEPSLSFFAAASFSFSFSLSPVSPSDFPHSSVAGFSGEPATVDSFSPSGDFPSLFVLSTSAAPTDDSVLSTADDSVFSVFSPTPNPSSHTRGATHIHSSFILNKYCTSQL